MESFKSGVSSKFDELSLNENMTNEMDSDRFSLPDDIWDHMMDLHKRMLTAIPRNRREYWASKVNEFYTQFTNTPEE